MKKISIIALILILLGVVAYPKLKGVLQDSSSDQNSETPRDSRLSVDVFVVQPQPFENKIFSTGTLLADEEVELRSEISGKVVDIRLEEGASVKRGDILLKINDTELQAQLNRAKFRLSLAEVTEERQRQLLEKGGISQEMYDTIVNEVNVLRAEVNLIEAQIDKTEIRAPFSGVVGLKYISNGSFISPTTQIATIQKLNPIKIDFSIPERYAGIIEPNDKIIFSVAGSEEDFDANIYAIEPRINTQTRTLSIRARAENREAKLLPGAFANLELILQEIPNALLVPSIAIIPELQGQKVFVLKNGKVEERKIEIGIRTSDSVQITKGVSAQDSVLTTGLLQVRPGMEVRVGEVSKNPNLESL